MTKGLSIPEGTTVYIPAVRVKYDNDNNDTVAFMNSRGYVQFMKDEHFLTEEELKAKFNEWLPKQGDIIEWSNERWVWVKERFITYYKGKFITVDDNGYYRGWNDCRIPKTELTLEQVEEKLGMEKGSLNIITN
jgi:hypothetical protein